MGGGGWCSLGIGKIVISYSASSAFFNDAELSGVRIFEGSLNDVDHYYISL